MTDEEEKIRRQVIDLATSLALQEEEETGENYTKVISKSLDEACIRLGVDRKTFIRMFI